MAGEKVLICGGGVAGSVLAYWLAKFDFEVKVIERSRQSQKAGQGIEIEEPALQVVKAMDIMEELRSIRTGEESFQMEDESGSILGSIKFDEPLSLTGALEMMRGDLVEVLYKAANKSDKVTYQYQTILRSLWQSEQEVVVELENLVGRQTSTESFDFVIGADGFRSRTRELAMGTTDELQCTKRIGAYVAYFSIPTVTEDWPNARLCNFPGHRIVWIRPVKKGSDASSVYLIHLADNIPALRVANAENDRQKQKQAFADLYKGLGWETSRVIDGMMEAENFYSDELTQIKLKSWSDNRVALVGDAAWAPTPFTGQGNQLAIIGAFVLAQEMSRNRTPTAYVNFEKRLRTYVEECQAIPLVGYAPYIACPKTSLGIWILRKSFQIALVVLRLGTWLNLARFLPSIGGDHFDLQIESPGH